MKAQAPGGDLHLAEVTKRFGATVAVDDVDLTVPQGSFFALLGPSGCGKTTSLRMVAGLEHPTAGRVRIGDQDITDLRPYRRPVNTVFQNFALFPHLDIFENVAFGLRQRRDKDIKTKVERMLELVQLPDHGRRKPGHLSGGQQQRVALARAIVNQPQVLLLDEPLGALDLKLRRQMQIELKRIQTEVGLTFVHVTHDQEEAMTMADTIAVMHDGRVEQLGTPAELYENPATTFVANFLGDSNLIDCAVTRRSGDQVVLDVGGHQLSVPAARNKATSDRCSVGVRPEKMHVVREGEAVEPGHNALPGVVTDSSFTGTSTQYLVRTSWDQELMVFVQNLSTRRRAEPGERVTLHWAPDHTFALDSSQDTRAGAETEASASTPAAAGASS